MAKKPEYIRFERVEPPITRKTQVWEIITNSSDKVIGRIHWFPEWRQYVFQPGVATIFNSECLHLIKQKLIKMNAEHREDLKREKANG